MTLRRYLLGLRLCWWDSGADALLSFVWFFPPIVLIWLIGSLIETFIFTYCYLYKKEKIHEFYFEVIDTSGIQKCRLHDRVFSTRPESRYTTCLEEV